MEYSNSSLVDKVIKSPNFTRGRVNISKITVHHMAGNLSIEACGKSFNNPSRSASANYLIGTDGRIALCVDEANRAWTSSSKWNDERAVTIEVANDGDESTGWHVSDKAFNALVNLCKDICKRNNITKLEYTGKKEGSLTIHSMFKATACPGAYLKSRLKDLCNLVNESETIAMAMCETYEKPANVEERSKERAEEAREIYNKYYTENSLYRVQVGAFRNRANAENMLNKLKTAGFVDAFVTEVKQ